jgi:hypothetical protein
MCQAESDNEACDYCGCTTVEVENIYEIRYTLTCVSCKSHVTKKIDHDKRDILEFPSFESRYCPVCEGHRMHERYLLSSSLKSYDVYLESAFQQELRKG